MAHKVVFSPEALDDLLGLYDYIAEAAGAERALGYVDRLEAACRDLALFPERGTRRDDFRPGLRILGFERRAVIALHVADESVTILRIFYGGRDVGSAFPEPEALR